MVEFIKLMVAITVLKYLFDKLPEKHSLRLATQLVMWTMVLSFLAIYLFIMVIVIILSLTIGFPD